MRKPTRHRNRPGYRRPARPRGCPTARSRPPSGARSLPEDSRGVTGPRRRRPKSALVRTKWPRPVLSRLRATHPIREHRPAPATKADPTTCPAFGRKYPVREAGCATGSLQAARLPRGATGRAKAPRPRPPAPFPRVGNLAASRPGHQGARLCPCAHDGDENFTALVQVDRQAPCLRGWRHA